MRVWILQRLALPLTLVFLVGGLGCSTTKTAAAQPTPTQKMQPKTELAEAEATDEEPAKKTYDAVPMIPLEILFGNPTKISPRLSPDGKRLAYLAPHEGVLNVWVRTVGQQDDKVVTADKKRGIRIYFWAENAEQIIYLQDKGGNENWHVYLTSAAGGATKDLTPIEGVQARIIAVEPSFPNTVLIGLNDRDPRLHDIYRVDLKTGERKLVQKNDLGAMAFVADHELMVRVAQVPTPDAGWKLLHRWGRRGKWKEVLKVKPEDSLTTGAWGFAGDNRTLHLHSSIGGDTLQVRGLDLKTRKEEVIASDETADAGDVFIHPTKHSIQAVAFDKARKEWKVLEEDVRADFAALTELHRGDFEVVSRDRADKTWLVAFVQDNGPVVYYTYERASKKGTFMFSHRPELEKLKLAEMKPVEYEARDGLTIRGYLTLPSGAEAKNLPTVVLPHGGPWWRNSWGYDGRAQWLANRGYAVLQPNFRGSTGYGKNFLNAANREWGGKMQDDITDGTKWLIDQGIADPKRTCIMGGSYGGYATLMGLVREPELYACGVDIVGVANLITWMKTIPPYWQPFADILYQRVGHPENDIEFLKERSPVFQAAKILAPLLIAQGANDPRVPKAESIQIRDALVNKGKKVEYIEFPDEGHGFARPENRLKFYRMAEKFLAEHLGGRYEQSPATPATE